MVHPADFVAAHLRHWKDAELLFKYDRCANADQLYGLCAECGLKAVMRRSRMQVEPLGVPTRPEHKVHVNKLWAEFPAFVSGRIGGRYVNLLLARNPFTNWSIGNRYAHDRHSTVRE